MSKQYFDYEHKNELRRIFTELADFMHLHKLEQIVSAGPSAAPFSKAIQRAYANRYGGNYPLLTSVKPAKSLDC